MIKLMGHADEFQSTPPHGGDEKEWTAGINQATFQSTPPHGGDGKNEQKVLPLLSNSKPFLHQFVNKKARHLRLFYKSKVMRVNFCAKLPVILCVLGVRATQKTAAKARLMSTAPV